VAILLTLARVTAFAQYSGPAILSRGEAPSAMASPQIKFAPYVDFSALYTDGLSGVSVTDTGTLPKTSSSGFSLSFGVSGLHSWKHTRVGLSYSGGLSHLTQESSFDSLNQNLLLGIDHSVSSHIRFNFNTTAGTFSRIFGSPGLQQTVPFDPASVYVPTTDFFDNRTEFFGEAANLTWQKTSRLSFNMGGNLSIARRRSAALFGSAVEAARGDVQYRINRRSTFGGNYSFQHFGSQGIKGGTDVHSFAADYSVQIQRRLDFSGFFGLQRSESKFLQETAVDPVIAILLGLSRTSQIVHSITTSPYASARISQVFHRGVLFASIGHAITPGNGLFLTSSQTSLLFGYSYSGVRGWGLSSTAGLDQAHSSANYVGGYRTAQAGVSVSHQLTRKTHFSASYSVRQYGSSDFANYNRVIQSLSVGVGFAPGNIPLRVW
jgi:hypothetical protein